MCHGGDHLRLSTALADGYRIERRLVSRPCIGSTAETLAVTGTGPHSVPTALQPRGPSRLGPGGLIAGIRERLGQRLAFTMIVSSGNVPAAVYIQDQLRRVGVRMEVQPLSAGIRPRLHGGDFDAAITSLFRDVDQRNYGLLRFMGRDGALDYRNAKAHALLNAALETLDPDSLQVLFDELAEVFRADPPVTYLYPIVWTTVAHRRIRGLSSPFRADIGMYMHELWIEEEW